jgi:pyruvate dehydrogenase E2 component (dihydrolipoamide acetyltransferase)
MADLVMPRLSDSMEEGTILKWLKGVGDSVAVGDELVEIETDKANMVYEADEAGTITELLAEEGDTLPIGEPIARVGEASGVSSEPAGGNGGPPSAREVDGPDPGEESKSQTVAGRAPDPTTGAAPAPTASPPTQPVSRPDGERIKASPIARRIASERGVDLAALSGSGPGGRIVKADVESAGTSAAPAPVAAAAPTGAAERPETAKGTTEVQELTKLQQIVARRMAESKATAPHFYLETEIDMSRCVGARARIKEAAKEGEVVPSFNDMVVKAAGIALREFPRANGAYKDGRFELYSRVNVGIAVAAQDSLVVPTVFDADRKGLREIAAESRALAQRVRDGSVTPPELSGGTFTVSNLGMYGITNFAAVINQPQAGILAVGAITEQPVVRGGEISTAHLMGVNLACDHRILYGADGAEFLARIRALLEEPLGLAL